jgi:hypothetical protein
MQALGALDASPHAKFLDADANPKVRTTPTNHRQLVKIVSFEVDTGSRQALDVFRAD